MKLTTPYIETRRLILRQIEPSDLQNYHTRLSSDPEVFRYLLGQWHNDTGRTTEKIRQIRAGYEAMDRCHWGIALKEEDTLIGTIALLGFDEDGASCSFAYMLGKAFWGRGYGREALEAVLAYGFRNLPLQRIHADHFADNPASGAVMKKAGMAYIGTVPEKYEKNGQKYDASGYEITRDMWIKKSSV